MKIIADSAIPFLRGVLEPYAEVHYLPGGAFTPEAVHDADALVIRTRTRCTESLLAGSSVQMIATATIGFDHIDTAWCYDHGIRVVTAAGCNARGVLQWMAAVLAGLAATEGWQPSQKTLGIVGVGHVGTLIREYAEAWGFRVLCCDPPRQASEHLGFIPLEEVAAQSDLLTFHTPLDPTTRHMANAQLFAHMKPDAIIINASRGEVVDGQALLRTSLRWAFDVWENEPHLDPALLQDALFATPHIAGYSQQGKANATSMSVRALSAHFGLPLSEWYPTEIIPSRPRPISWSAMCATINEGFDIGTLSAELKARPLDFESMRDNYPYREEHF